MVILIINVEVPEETGLIVNDVKEVAFTNNIFEKDQKHYVRPFVQGV